MVREGDLPVENYIYDAFIAIWRETRRPVTTESLAVASGADIETIRRYMSILERSGDAVWRDGGWVPADEG